MVVECIKQETKQNGVSRNYFFDFVCKMHSLAVLHVQKKIQTNALQLLFKLSVLYCYCFFSPQALFSPFSSLLCFDLTPWGPAVFALTPVHHFTLAGLAMETR